MLHDWCIDPCYSVVVKISTLWMARRYVSSIFIIFYFIMLVSYHYYMFLPSLLVILWHFIVLTYWQDAQCQFPVFCCFVFSENPLRENHRNWLKIYGNYLWNEMKTESRGKPEGPPGGQGRPPAKGGGGNRPAPGGSPWPPPMLIKSQ